MVSRRLSTRVCLSQGNRRMVRLASECWVLFVSTHLNISITPLKLTPLVELMPLIFCRSQKMQNHICKDGNQRAALRWSIVHCAETAGRIAAAIRYFWNFQGYLTEGLRWSEAVLNLGQEIPKEARWKILSMAGNLARFLGNHQTARDMYEEGLAEGRAINNLSQISLSCRGLSGLAMEQGEYGAARRFLEEALTSARQASDQFGVARSLSMMGDLARTRGDNLQARPLYEEALAICRRLGN